MRKRTTAATTAKPPVKYGSDLKVGDIIRTIGRDDPITAITPYKNHHLFDFMDERWTVAHSGDSGRTIDPDCLFAQLDNGVWVTAHHYPGSVGAPYQRPRPNKTAKA